MQVSNNTKANMEALIAAFQNIDAGKPKGNDMQEGKLTLPVRHAVEAATGTDGAYFRRVALKVRAHEASRLEIQELVDFTIRTGGVSYAEAEMCRLRNEAVAQLGTLVNSEIAAALEQYIDFVVTRKS